MKQHRQNEIVVQKHRRIKREKKMRKERIVVRKIPDRTTFTGLINIPFISSASASSNPPSCCFVFINSSSKTVCSDAINRSQSIKESQSSRSIYQNIRIQSIQHREWMERKSVDEEESYTIGMDFIYIIVYGNGM